MCVRVQREVEGEVPFSRNPGRWQGILSIFLPIPVLAGTLGTGRVRCCCLHYAKVDWMCGLGELFLGASSRSPAGRIHHSTTIELRTNLGTRSRWEEAFPLCFLKMCRERDRDREDTAWGLWPGSESGDLDGSAEVFLFVSSPLPCFLGMVRKTGLLGCRGRHSEGKLTWPGVFCCEECEYQKRRRAHTYTYTFQEKA